MQQPALQGPGGIAFQGEAFAALPGHQSINPATDYRLCHPFPDCYSSTDSHCEPEEDEVSSDPSSPHSARCAPASSLACALPTSKVIPCRGGYLVIRRQRSHSAVHRALGPTSRSTSRGPPSPALSGQATPQPPPHPPTPALHWPPSRPSPPATSGLTPGLGARPQQPHSSSPLMRQLLAELLSLAGQGAAQQALAPAPAPTALDAQCLHPLPSSSTAATAAHPMAFCQGANCGVGPNHATPLVQAGALLARRPSPPLLGLAQPPVGPALIHESECAALAAVLLPEPGAPSDSLVVMRELLRLALRRTTANDLLLRLALQRRAAGTAPAAADAGRVGHFWPYGNDWAPQQMG